MKYLFIIGPQRTGTSWLYSFFLRYNNVYIDRLEKENYFFFKNRYNDSLDNKRKFIRKLKGFGDPVLYVDICSTYFGHKSQLKSILSSFPEAYFIYIHREEFSRKKSFEGHRNFNKPASWILGYLISWQLYERQERFTEFEVFLNKQIDKKKLLKLEFNELKADSGKQWVKRINEFLDTEFRSENLGIINKSRSESSILKRYSFVLVRIAQKLRIHIFFRWTKLIILSFRKKGDL